MSQQVRGVVARGKGQPVSIETIVIPDPGPGKAPGKNPEKKPDAKPPAGAKPAAAPAGGKK